MQVWALPSMAHRVAETFPEVRPIVVPSIAWGIVAILCLQVAAVIGMRVLTLVRSGRSDASAHRLLRAVLACLIVFVALVAVAWTALTVLEWATPGVVLGLFIGGVLAIVAIVSLARLLRSVASGRL